MHIKITQIFNKYLLLSLTFFLFVSNDLFSQSITMPSYNLGPSKFCQKSSIANTYDFVFNTSGFTAGNTTFRLELSDVNGSFATTTILDTKNLPNGNGNFLTLTVVPTIVGSDNYKVRVVNVSQGAISPESITFPIFYKVFEGDDFKINNFSSFTTICSSAGVTISVTNIPADKLVNLRFKWFKNNVLIPGETTSSLLITSQGVYYAAIDYGTFCSNPIIRSQDVTANFYTSGRTYLITSSNGVFVDTGVPTTLSTIDSPGVTYQWFDTNGLISGATDYNYTTDFAGTYYVEVSDGTCPTKSNSLTLTKLIVPITTGKVIPNIVSPNNDGENDTWKLEKKYTGDSRTNILILDSKGKIALETDAYLNDWPGSTIDFDTINPVYYYIITPQSGDVKKGSITIVK